MKSIKFFLVTLVMFLAMSFTTVSAAEEQGASWERNLGNVGRGFVNVLTCCWEVPRCLILRNSQVPVLGIVAGACEGAGLTGVRALAGVGDILSLGFMTDKVYHVSADFQEWVWDSTWIPQY